MWHNISVHMTSITPNGILHEVAIGACISLHVSGLEAILVEKFISLYFKLSA